MVIAYDRSTYLLCPRGCKALWITADQNGAINSVQSVVFRPAGVLQMMRKDNSHQHPIELIELIELIES